MKNNPQMQQAWQVAQSIQAKGGSKEQMLRTACQQSGMDYDQVKQNLSKFGINI